MRKWGAAISLCGALALPAIVAPSFGWSGPLLQVAGGVIALCLWMGARRRAPEARGAWYTLAAGMTLWLLGDVVWDCYTWFGSGLPEVSWADAFYVAGYPVLALGVARMVTLRSPGRGREGWLDGAAFAIAACVAAWAFIIVPDTEGVGSVLHAVVYGAYPVGDVFLVAALLWLVLSPGARSTPTALIMASLIGTALLDVAYSVTPRVAPSFDLGWFDGWYTVTYALLAGAVLHPHADELTDTSPQGMQRLHPARVVFLGAALFTAPVIAVGRASDMAVPTRVFFLAASFGIGTIVLARFALAARERESARDSLAFKATHDELTGLVNRTLLLDRIDHALAQRDGNTIAVLYFDLDRFKPINDTWGHRAGDAVLTTVAARVQEIVRDGDTLARVGGDEFVVLCESVASPTDAIGVAQRIVDVVGNPIHLEVGVVSVGASVGIAFPTTQSSTPESLVRDADAAMYRAKENGRDRFEVYDAAMRGWIEERRATEAALHQAVRDGELRLVYQPVVHLASGEVTAFEALLRWVRPGHGVVAPAEFIDIAEDTGMIVPIGAWVLEEACRQLAAWNAAHPERPPLEMAVNVSVRQFRHASFMRTLQHALAAAGIPPNQLTLEVTESMLISDADAAIAQLQAAKRLGVRIAIDDFGTGYSSLAYLRRFPFDVVKIDRTFTQDIGNGAADTTLVAGVVALTHVLGHSVVAEGAETMEQVMSLHALRCDFVQGYYFSTPLDARNATALVAGDRNLVARRASSDAA